MDGNMTSLWLDCEDGMTWFEDQTSTLADKTNPRGIQRMRMDDQQDREDQQACEREEDDVKEDDIWGNSEDEEYLEEYSMKRFDG